jgi:hypothetical protein
MQGAAWSRDQLPPIGDKPREATPMPRENEPKRHTLTLTSHSMTHLFLYTLTKKSLFINKNAHTEQKKPLFG